MRLHDHTSGGPLGLASVSVANWSTRIPGRAPESHTHWTESRGTLNDLCVPGLEPNVGRSKMSPTTPYREVTFSARLRPFWASVRRILTPVGIVISFGPGVAIVAGALVVGPDKWVAFIGLIWLCAASWIWWVNLSYVDEVSIVDEVLIWRGAFRQGACPVNELEEVVPAWRGPAMRFKLRHESFAVVTARELDPFLRELRAIRPDLTIRHPIRLRLFARPMPRGRLEVHKSENSGDAVAK